MVFTGIIVNACVFGLLKGPLNYGNAVEAPLPTTQLQLLNSPMPYMITFAAPGAYPCYYDEAIEELGKLAF
jgi:hypothetical protein